MVQRYFRVTEAAWNDLGIAEEARVVSNDPAIQPNGLVRKLVTSFGHTGPVTGTLLEDVKKRRDKMVKSNDRLAHPFADKPVWRIRVTEASNTALRGAVVWDDELDVVWLCRAVNISDYSYPQEENAYNALGAMWENGEMLPTEKERADAMNEAYWDSFVDALIEAKAVAEQHPGQWVNADVGLRTGEIVTIGSAFFEAEEHADGSYTTRYFVIVRRDPGDIAARPTAWLEVVTAELFEEATDEVDPAAAAWEIPGGRYLDPSKEVALRQSALHFKI